MNRYILFLTVLTSTISTASAENRSITYEEILHSSLLEGVEAARIDSSIAERTAEAFQVKNRDNPVLTGEAGFPTGSSQSKTEWASSISQTVRPTDFGERTLLAEIISSTADLEKKLALTEFAQNLSLLYSRAWLLQELDAVLTRAADQSRQAMEKISSGAKSGLFPEGDVALFKAELKILEADKIANRSDRLRTTAELVKFSGIDISNLTQLPLQSVATISRAELEQLIASNGSAVQNRYLLASRLSGQQLEVAKMDSLPNITPSLGYRRSEEGTDQITFGLSLPLPIFNRNEAEIVRAKASQIVAERGVRYGSSPEMRAEILLLFDSMIAVKQQLELYEKEILPLKEKALDAYQRQFNSGSSTAFQLWQAQRELNQTAIKRLELYSNLAQSRSQLNLAIGESRF